jgi:hypothetical protein
MRPGHVLRPILIEARQSAVKFSLLRGLDRHPLVGEAIPKLRDERQALVGGQLHRSKLGQGGLDGNNHLGMLNHH